MTIRFLFFLGSLFFFHFVPYLFLRLNLELNSRQYFWLAIVFVILLLTFIVSLILVHQWSNCWTSSFYFLSGIWLGFLFTLFTFSLIAWFLLAICPCGISRRIVALVVIITSLLVSVWGVWNVYHYRIKNIEITLPNLPTEWQGKQIVHLSDLHLGSILGQRFAKNIVRQVNALEPDLILITGDLFDSITDDTEALAQSLDSLKAKQGVYYVTGNHETYGSGTRIMEAMQATDIHILNDEVVDLNGLQIVGIAYPNRGEEKNGAETIRNNPLFDHQKTNILLYHVPTGLNSHQKQDAYLSPQVDFTETANLGVDLQLSGHTHQGQLLPFNFLTKLIFRGYEYGLHQVGDFQIYITSGVGTWGPTMRTWGRSEIVLINLK